MNINLIILIIRSIKLLSPQKQFTHLIDLIDFDNLFSMWKMKKGVNKQYKKKL